MLEMAEKVKCHPAHAYVTESPLSVFLPLHFLTLGLGSLRGSTVPLLRDFPQPGMPSTPHFGHRLSSASCFQCILPCQTIWNSAYFLLLNLVYFTSWYTQTVCMYLSVCKCLIFIFKFQEKRIPVVSFFFF